MVVSNMPQTVQDTVAPLPAYVKCLYTHLASAVKAGESICQ